MFISAFVNYAEPPEERGESKKKRAWGGGLPWAGSGAKAEL